MGLFSFHESVLLNICCVCLLSLTYLRVFVGRASFLAPLPKFSDGNAPINQVQPARPFSVHPAPSDDAKPTVVSSNSHSYISVPFYFILSFFPSNLFYIQLTCVTYVRHYVLCMPSNDYKPLRVHLDVAWTVNWLYCCRGKHLVLFYRVMLCSQFLFLAKNM